MSLGTRLSLEDESLRGPHLPLSTTRGSTSRSHPFSPLASPKSPHGRRASATSRKSGEMLYDAFGEHERLQLGEHSEDESEGSIKESAGVKGKG